MRTHSTAASSTANTARPEAISTARGKALWRSLDELADTDEFRRWLHHEFPPGSLDHLAGISRRRFLKILAASFALAGGVSCDSGPPRFIVPYVQEPEPIVPGKPLYFATALTRNGYALGVLVESHTGRPTKIEGNIHHPASLGSTDIFAQAELLTLYDPDRSQAAYFRNGINTWDQFARDLAARLGELRARNGRGLYLLTGAISSPTLLRQIQQILDLFPQARWHAYEPVTDENTRLAGRTAFGRDVDLIHRLDRADVIVSLDADFLLESPGRVRYAREFSNRRRARAGEAFDPRTMNRLYVVEPTLTLTGANADHRLPMRASRIGAWARQLARELGLAVPQTGPPQLDEASQRWARVVAQDLQRHPGAGLILVGDAQPADVHVLAHAMNTALGNVGRTILPIEPVAMRAGGEGPPASLIELVEAIDAGEVDTLIILDRNPIYDAPADLRFEERLSRVPFSVHMGLYRDETAQQCLWHLPMTHELESWSDARAFEGTVTILQPLITPLYRGRTAHELMAMLAGETNLTAYQIVRQTWQARAGQGDFESWWQEALRRGVVPDTAAPVLALSPDARAILDAVGSSTVQADEGSSLEITFKPDPTLWDGRYANNGWLQELPKPPSMLAWDNAALVSPAAAQRLNLINEQIVELSFQGRSIRAAVWILPGQADDCVTLYLGHGRSAAGGVGSGQGFNAYVLRTAEAMGFGAGLQLQATAQRYLLACVQHHWSMEDRHPVRSGSAEAFAQNPAGLVRNEHEDGRGVRLSLLPEFVYSGQQWGMAIDLSTCIGCRACTIACQAENVIPIVGKENVIRGREMHWIRIDHYYEGSPENPRVYHQPRPCMHCEKAPCELVCPVAATKHSHDGLNEMVYNRCVGTRYCSNNCPYKVRRFNFFDYYSKQDPSSLQLMRNPQVSVRRRGVMEKCTYCVQRIRAVQIQAKREGRAIRDGELMTACQQVCPTDAIVFGDINDPGSGVSAVKRQPHNYGLLAHLNTQPRTTYLAAVRNPNPELA